MISGLTSLYSLFDEFPIPSCEEQFNGEYIIFSFVRGNSVGQPRVPDHQGVPVHLLHNIKVTHVFIVTWKINWGWGQTTS